MRRLSWMLVAALSLVPLMAEARAKVEPIASPLEIPVAAKATAAQVKLAAHLAVGGRGWTIENKTADGFEAVYAQEGRRSSFTCRIKVTHSAKAVTVTHVSSEGLDFDGDSINANYNKWMRMLEADVPVFVDRIVAAQ